MRTPSVCFSPSLYGWAVEHSPPPPPQKKKITLSLFQKKLPESGSGAGAKQRNAWDDDVPLSSDGVLREIRGEVRLQTPLVLFSQCVVILTKTRENYDV